jgi:aminotransferase in exopolysaccharide biosynthesis
VKSIKTSEVFLTQVLDAIRSVVGTNPVVLHEPVFQGNEWLYLKECLDSTIVSSVGKFVDQFENNLAEYTGAKYAIAVVNGTAALQIALNLAGVKPNDEVLIPALTFVATANSVTYCHAIPHFVDSEERTLGIDTTKLREYLKSNTTQYSGQCVNIITGRVIRALVPMHTFGHPSDIEGLLSIASEFNITLVEDAAESLGSFYYGQHTGTFGLFGTLSFNGNKTITTGGGGAILTNDKALARHAKHLTTTAKVPHTWEFLHDEIGYNYRLPNINAALGCAQIESLDWMLAEKRKLFSLYKNAFKGVGGLNLYCEPQGCKSNYWLQSIILDASTSMYRDQILELTNQEGIMTRPVWNLLSTLKPFLNSPKMNLDSAIFMSERIVNIPSSASITKGTK